MKGWIFNPVRVGMLWIERMIKTLSSHPPGRSLNPPRYSERGGYAEEEERFHLSKPILLTSYRSQNKTTWYENGWYPGTFVTRKVKYNIYQDEEGSSFLLLLEITVTIIAVPSVPIKNYSHIVNNLISEATIAAIRPSALALLLFKISYS